MMAALGKLVGTLFATAMLFVSLVLMHVIDSFETSPFCSSTRARLQSIAIKFDTRSPRVG